MTIRSFLDRFVHPRLAAIAIGGIVLWGVSFLVAATGLAVRSTDTLLAIDLFFASGVLGVFGMAILACCGLWLVGLRATQVVRGERG
ncbi:MAG TPA: hypothetical protein VFJ06_02580 [Halococcus sp.]|nr:hypothetical protein [Halococcus sp.]